MSPTEIFTTYVVVAVGSKSLIAPIITCTKMHFGEAKLQTKCDFSTIFKVRAQTRNDIRS